jgi:hypothetical protein
VGISPLVSLPLQLLSIAKRAIAKCLRIGVQSTVPKSPLILTLARGHNCAKEHQTHLELAAFYLKIAVAHTQIAAISTDDHHTLQEFRASVGAQWTFLSDPERTVQKNLDITEYTDDFDTLKWVLPQVPCWSWGYLRDRRSVGQDAGSE